MDKLYLEVSVECEPGEVGAVDILIVQALHPVKCETGYSFGQRDYSIHFKSHKKRLHGLNVIKASFSNSGFKPQFQFNDRLYNMQKKIESCVVGYDYDKQAWVVDGKYVRCNHPKEMDCQCYGKEHEGEKFTGGEQNDRQ